MKNVKIIAVVGMTGSGKGTITDMLEKRGYPVIHFGNMLYEEVEKRGLDLVEHETEVRHDMRRLEGLAVFAKRVSTKVDVLIDQGKTTVVLDGLYTWSEYKHLSEKYGSQLTVVAVVAPKKLRWNRVIKRADSRRKYNKDEVIARELDEIENMEKGGPIAYADYYVNNNGDMQQFLSDLEKLFTELSI